MNSFKKYFFYSLFFYIPGTSLGQTQRVSFKGQQSQFFQSKEHQAHKYGKNSRAQSISKKDVDKPQTWLLIKNPQF